MARNKRGHPRSTPLATKQPGKSKPKTNQQKKNDHEEKDGNHNGQQQRSTTTIIGWWPWIVAALVVLLGIAMVREDPASSKTEPETPPAPSSQAVHDKDTAAEHSALFTSHGTFELLETLPHDPKAFTQGLELKNATHFYESVGNYKESSVRIVEIVTGKVVQETKLDDVYFAEGLSLCHVQQDNGEDHQPQRQLILLTWREKTAFRIDPETLETLESFPYSTSNGEGWGIACDNSKKQWHVTDGTHFLQTWDGTTLDELSKQQITYRLPTQPTQTSSSSSSSSLERPLSHVNELEYDSTSNTIIANIWYQDFLVRIDPTTGFVLKIYNLQSLRPRESRGPKEDCLNGVALDTTTGGAVVWVTGKWWPVVYKIRLIDS